MDFDAQQAARSGEARQIKGFRAGQRCRAITAETGKKRQILPGLQTAKTPQIGAKNAKHR